MEGDSIQPMVELKSKRKNINNKVDPSVISQPRVQSPIEKPKKISHDQENND